MWNMRMTVKTIVVSLLGTVLKILERELEELEIRERNETIQTALLRSTRVQETCCHSDFSERRNVKAGVKILLGKNSPGEDMIE